MGCSEKKYIIFAGANGSGKSTLYNLHPECMCMPRINADELVCKYGDWSDISAQLRAGREAAALLNHCLNSDKSFNQETTLCGKSILKNIEKAKISGFKVEVHYTGVDSVKICKERIRHRVAIGGHDVPNLDIERRYYESLEKIKHILELCDVVYFYDNTVQFSLIAIYEKGSMDVLSEEIPKWFKHCVMSQEKRPLDSK